uniref:Protein Wnt n=1 Tax=Macrostomum lignano TaxID=282301 RepID=A0A1I8FRA5_9PLAT
MFKFKLRPSDPLSPLNGAPPHDALEKETLFVTFSEPETLPSQPRSNLTNKNFNAININMRLTQLAPSVLVCIAFMSAAMQALWNDDDGSDSYLKDSRWWSLHRLAYRDARLERSRSSIPLQPGVNGRSFSPKKCSFDPELIRAAPLQGVKHGPARECERHDGDRTLELFRIAPIINMGSRIFLVDCFGEGFAKTLLLRTITGGRAGTVRYDLGLPATTTIQQGARGRCEDDEEALPLPRATSGSCTYRTCWKECVASSPVQDIQNDSPLPGRLRVAGDARILNLVKVEEHSNRLDPAETTYWSVLGTRQRICDAHGGNCSHILLRQAVQDAEYYKHLTQKCNCRFIWCCEVKCEVCITDKHRKVCS